MGTGDGRHYFRRLPSLSAGDGRYPVGMSPKPNVVAVINSTPDVVDMLRLALERGGFVAVTAMTHDIRDGVVDLEAFSSQHDPKVIVYDIAPPYDGNWQLFQHIRQMPFMKDRFFVLTSVNKRHVQQVAGSDHQIFEIIGKPMDLDEIIGAVRQATKARPTRA
jgi:CheY-like chemotaxis protein